MQLCRPCTPLLKMHLSVVIKTFSAIYRVYEAAPRFPTNKNKTPFSETKMPIQGQSTSESRRKFLLEISTGGPREGAKNPLGERSPDNPNEYSRSKLLPEFLNVNFIE